MEEKSTPETLTTACHAASWLVSVIKIIDSAPIRIIDRISLTQRCHLSTGVPIVQGLARR